MAKLSEPLVYVLFPENFKTLTKDEYNNLWWDIDEPPNSDDEGIHMTHYDLLFGYDTMDPGLISNHTTEKYVLEIYTDECLDLFPIVKKVMDTKPSKYVSEIHGKRHMTEEEIQKSLNHEYD